MEDLIVIKVEDLEMWARGKVNIDKWDFRGGINPELPTINLTELVKKMKANVPQRLDLFVGDKNTEEALDYVNNSIVYAGRFNYNKALDDLLAEIKKGVV